MPFWDFFSNLSGHCLDLTSSLENILPASTAAPGLQEKQKEVRLPAACDGFCLVEPNSLILWKHQLEKHMRADSLNEKISHRPPPEKLMQEGLLHEDPRSAEEKYEEAMEDEYAKREGGA